MARYISRDFVLTTRRETRLPVQNVSWAARNVWWIAQNAYCIVSLDFWQTAFHKRISWACVAWALSVYWHDFIFDQMALHSSCPFLLSLYGNVSVWFWPWLFVESCVLTNYVQWNFRIKDTSGAELLSSFRRFILSKKNVINVCIDVQEAKELAETKAFFHGLQYASRVWFYATLLHFELWDQRKQCVAIRIEKHLKCEKLLGLAGWNTWKQEIRREHNSNPLQRHEHVHFRDMFYFNWWFISTLVFQALITLVVGNVQFPIYTHVGNDCAFCASYNVWMLSVWVLWWFPLLIHRMWWMKAST